MGLLVVVETNQLIVNFFVVEVGKLILPDIYSLCGTWCFVQVIIATEAAVIDYFKYHFTSGAAKKMLFLLNVPGRAGFATMAATGCIRNDIFHRS